MTRTARSLLGAAGAAAFILLWYTASALKWVDPQLLLSPDAVLRSFVQNWTTPTVAKSVYTMQVAGTVRHMLVGLAIAMALGISLGMMIGWSRWLETRLDLSLTLIQYLPPAVVVPVVLLFFGKSDATVLVVIAFGATWPILLNTVDGVRGVDPLLVEVARLYRLRAHEIAFKIVLPMALPQMIAGLRLAVSVSLLATVVGEMLGGTNGVGYLILVAQRTFEYREMYSGILMLGLLGIAANALFRLIEVRILYWHPATRREAL